MASAKLRSSSACSLIALSDSFWDSFWDSFGKDFRSTFLKLLLNIVDFWVICFIGANCLRTAVDFALES